MGQGSALQKWKGCFNSLTQVTSVVAVLPNNANAQINYIAGPLYVSTFAISDMQMGKQLSTIKWVSEVKLQMQHFYGLCN